MIILHVSHIINNPSLVAWTVEHSSSLDVEHLSFLHLAVAAVILKELCTH